MALNAHRVFTGPAEANHYLAALTLEDRRKAELREARDRCREAIKGGLHDWSGVISKAQLFEAMAADAAPAALRPKFKMQGSFAYHTLNDPAQSPPQEIDLDDGVFLPVSFLNSDGNSHPVVISAGYFKAVEASLEAVCRKEGWTLITDKPSCVRVKIGDDAHIDFALYAIPDEEFAELVEKELMARSLGADSRRFLTEASEFADDLYRGLREDQIMLAHRDDGWKPSDPRKLEEWFQKALKQHGEQLRRVCRYLKGWRDFSWPVSRLSSIALMASVVDIYDNLRNAFHSNRDDQALLLVAERLPDALGRRIKNPVVDGQFLDEGWSPNDRAKYVNRAKSLVERVSDAINNTDDAEKALASLEHAFGGRIPDDVTLIVAEGDENIGAPAILTSGLVKSMGSEAAPQAAARREGDRRYG